MRKIKVIIKEPGKKPRSVRISDTEKNLQRTVGGYVDMITIATDLKVLCNEGGRRDGLPWCCNICGVDFVGTVVFVGLDKGEFTDVPCTYDEVKRLFPRLWEDVE